MENGRSNGTILDLESRKGSKKEAQARLNQLLDKINAGDLYLSDSMTHAERERNRVANSPVEDYLTEWLEGHKGNIAASTYRDYKSYIDKRMIPFFAPMHLMVKEITGDEINSFYQSMFAEGLKGTTIQRYHAVLHEAFKDAVKRRILPSNPAEQADRPKGQQFIGSYYNAEEIKHLLAVTADDEIHLPILLTAAYGLRRSEVLGLKWSAIDQTEKKIYIRHKVIEGEGGEATGLDVMKTKSSYRTLPLLPFIEEELMKEKAKQEEMRAVMRGGYCRDYLDYVCIDALGRLFKPGFVTSHFETLLKQNGLRPIRFHDLRHSCASLLLAKKVPMKMIQDWLGHSDMATTANIYSHIDAESKKESAEVIARALNMEE